MKHELFNTFGLLCESLLQEASVSINMLPDRTKPLIQYLHKYEDLPHNMGNYKEVDKFNWASIKKKDSSYWRDSESKHWLIILGTKGAACFIPAGGNWRAITYNKEEGINKQTFSRLDESMRFVKSKIGSLQRYFEGYGKKTKHRPKPMLPGTVPVTTEDLLARLRPTFAKSLEKAIADVRGMVITQIKNDAYEKVGGRITKLAQLTALLDAVRDKNSIISPASLLGKAINTALLMTASQYYPDDTGPITRRHGGELQAQNTVGARRVAAEIGKGDMNKLATVLYYMRRELIAQ